MEPQDFGEQDTQRTGHSDFQKENLRGEKGTEVEEGNHEKDGTADSRSSGVRGMSD